MKYKTIKKVIALLMLQVLIFSMIGCSSILGSQTENGEAYIEQIVLSDWMQQQINRLSIQNNIVYFSTYGETLSFDGEEHYCNNRLYSVNKNGEGLKEIPIDLTKEEPLIMITGILSNADDTISVWLSTPDFFETEQVNVLIKVDNTGKELMRKDLNQLVNGQYVSKVLETSQGQIAAMTEKSVFLFDESLELMKEVEINGYAVGMAYTRENRLICASEEDNGKKRFHIIDPEQGNVMESISLKRGESVEYNALFNSTQYDFCYRNEKGIYSYDIEKKKSTCLLNYEKSNIVNEDIINAVSAGEDSFAVIDYSHDGSGCSIIVYTKPGESAKNSKTTIVFGALQLDENIERAVYDFNKSNAKYQITLKEYFDEESGDNAADMAMERLNEDIAKGTIPDIMDLSLLTEQYASKGLFEDLMPYLEKDEEINEDIFVDSVFDAMKQKDKLYYVSPDFGIATILGKSEYEECAGWTIEELTAFCESQKDAIPFYASSKIDLLNILLEGNLGEFCDWENGECQFDNQEFQDILTFCNSATLNAESDTSNMERDELIREGKVLWIADPEFVPQDIMTYKELYGEEIVYVGYPNKEGQGNYFAFINQIGICSKSEVKDGAWEFLRMLLSQEYQKQYAELNTGVNRIPVRSDCFDLLMSQLANPEEDMEGMEDDNNVISPAQEEAFRNLVADTHKVLSFDMEVMAIINEEAQSYFSGEKDLDETVQMIQNRCNTYMNEQK